MNSTEILTLITILVSWILGIVAKKVRWFNNYLIPVQNVIVGIIFALIEFFITKDINIAIAMSGLLAGGVYDVFSNLKKMLNQIETDIKKEEL